MKAADIEILAMAVEGYQTSLNRFQGQLDSLRGLITECRNAGAPAAPEPAATTKKQKTRGWTPKQRAEAAERARLAWSRRRQPAAPAAPAARKRRGHKKARQ